MQLILDQFTKSFGDTLVIPGMDLTVRDGEMLALLGPSGCGKSTTLFAIAGIHRASSGRILFGDRDVGDLPSQKRNVGVVFQNYALYPHMTVAQNIAFPLEVAGHPRQRIESEVRDIARLVQIEPLMQRRPSELSGGQQQRVALARAIVRRPAVLLLDEPLANLDAKLRLEMRSEIRRIQQETGITAILVTHDQVEAMSMCDRVAIMEGGVIRQIDTPDAMYRNPASRFVAGFLGNPPIVFVEGHADEAGGLAVAGGTLPLPPGVARPAGTALALGIRPEHFGTTGRARLTGEISFIEPQGRETLFDVTLPGGQVLRSIQPARTDLSIGTRVDWPLDAGGLLAFDAQGRRL